MISKRNYEDVEVQGLIEHFFQYPPPPPPPSSVANASGQQVVRTIFLLSHRWICIPPPIVLSRKVDRQNSQMPKEFNKVLLLLILFNQGFILQYLYTSLWGRALSLVHKMAEEKIENEVEWDHQHEEGSDKTMDYRHRMYLTSCLYLVGFLVNA